MDTSGGNRSEEWSSRISIWKLNKGPGDQITKTRVVGSGLHRLQTTFHLLVVRILHVHYPRGDSPWFGFHYVTKVHYLRTVVMCLFWRSWASDRVLGHLVRRFHSGGNEKVMRFMETNIKPELWPVLTDWPGYIGQIRSYPVGYIGQTGSHPVGTTVISGLTQRVWESSSEFGGDLDREHPCTPLPDTIYPRNITKHQKNAIFNVFRVCKRRVTGFHLSFGLGCGYKVFSRVRRCGNHRPTAPDT